jgi:hypothetical protein
MPDNFIRRRIRVLLLLAQGRRGQSLPEVWNYFTRKWSRKKPSLVVAVGKRRSGNALLEYQRRFEAPDDPRLQPGPKLIAHQPASAEQTLQPKARASGEREKPDRRARTSRREGGGEFRKARTRAPGITVRLFKALRGSGIGGREALAIASGCAIVIGGASLYLPLTTATEQSRSVDKAIQSSGAKLSYDRLLPDRSNLAVASATLTAAAPEHRARLAGGPEDPPSILPKQQAPAVQSQPVLPDRPTVVRSERYLPDGTRVGAEAGVVPSVVRLGPEQARPPFLAAAQPVVSAPARNEEVKPAPSDYLPPQAARDFQSKDVPGYYIQVKSDQDSGAAQSELKAIEEKFSAILGDASLSIRSVDLKDKGTWFRVLAGPLKTREIAENLCLKMKRAGHPGCLVHRLD